MSNKTSHAFVLKSIRLQNFTTFNDVTLTPESHGLTGIAGQNGAGKSSFVDALLFALYGVTPDKKELIRRNKVPAKGNTTSVTVIFTHAGQTVQVTREMSGTNHKVTAKIHVDGEQVTNITGTTAAAWITKRLGIDANGFKTAIVVPQEQLNSLISLIPSKRREMIEDLAGIGNYNNGLGRARKAKNTQATKVNAMLGDPVDLANAEGINLLISKNIESYEKSLNEEVHNEDILNTRVKDLLSEYELKVKYYRENLDRSNTFSNLSGQLANLIQNEAQNLQYLSRFDVSSQDGAELDRNELRTSYTNANSKIKFNIENLNKYQSLVHSIDQVTNASGNKINELESRVAAYENSFKEAQNALEAIRNDPANKDLLSSLESVEGRIKARSESINVLASNNTGFNKSTKAIQESIHEAECPTCHTSLNDPQKLINEFNEIIVKNNMQMNLLNEENASDQTILNNIQRLQQSIMQQENELNNQEQQLNFVKSNLITTKEETESELNDLKNRLETNFGNFVPEKVIEENNELQSHLQEITLKGEKAKQFEESRAIIESTQKELEQTRLKIQEINDNIQVLNEESTIYSKEELQELSDQLSTKDTEINHLKNQLNQMKDTKQELALSLATEKEKFSASTKNVEREKELLSAKKDALQELAIKTNVANLLEAARLYQIGRIAPELSDTATDMISQMTNGRYIQVHVTEDFDVIVTDEKGSDYTIPMLSGGERAIVALILRISIANLISGEDAGLLWLDEVLPAQDPVRRDAILQVIRNLPIQQVVMINHTHDAEDVVDKVIRVEHSHDGSTLEVGQ